MKLSIDFRTHALGVVLFALCLLHMSGICVAGNLIVGQDFLVNDDSTGRSNFQTSSAVAWRGAEGPIASWIDRRTTESHVYVQRFDAAGAPIGGLIQVTDAPVWTRAYTAISVNDSNEFVVVWNDYRDDSPYAHIYAQKFDATGNRIGSNFRVSEISCFCDVPPDVSYTTSGGFAVVWTVTGSVYAQLYDPSMSPIGSNIRVDSDTTRLALAVAVTSRAPVVSCMSDGGIAVAWRAVHGGAAQDVMLRRLDSLGNVSGAAVRVNDTQAENYMEGTDIAAYPNGDYAVVWGEGRGGFHVFGQRFAADNQRLGGNFQVSDDTITVGDYSPVVGVDERSNMIVSWCEYFIPPTSYGLVRYQRYDAAGIPVGANTLLGEAGEYIYAASYPALGVCDNGASMVAWEVGADIWVNVVDTAGASLGEKFRVADDAGCSDQTLPAVAAAGETQVRLAWGDKRDGSSSHASSYAYMQSMLLGGSTAIDAVNGMVGGPIYGRTDVAVDLQGKSVVVWDKGKQVFAQRIDASGAPIDSTVQVNDSAYTSNMAMHPAVSMDSAGNYVVVWEYSRSSSSSQQHDVYAQRYDNTGARIGDNMTVTEPFIASGFLYPNVAMNANGTWLAIWTDKRSGDADIYAQRVSAAGSTLGVNVKVNDDLGSEGQTLPDVSFDETGSAAIVWMDSRDDPSAIYLQAYDPSGNEIDSNIRVSDYGGGALQAYPALASDKAGQFYVIWEDYRAGNADIYGQRHVLGQILAPLNTRVTDPSGADFKQQRPAIAALSNTLIVTWQDNRRSAGWDVYAKILTSPTSADDDYVFTPSSVTLKQNTPNPFNASCEIEYVLPVTGLVRLMVFDILGREVTTLVNDIEAAGIHTVRWNGELENGSPAPSGMYLYRLENNGVMATRTMILLK